MFNLQLARRSRLWVTLLLSLILTVSCSNFKIASSPSSSPSLASTSTLIPSSTLTPTPSPSSSPALNRTYETYEVSSAPTIVQGVMYFGGQERFAASRLTSNVLAVDVETAKENWRFKLPDKGNKVGYQPLIDDGVVYVGTTGLNPHVYALDMQTGKLKWQFISSANVISPLVVTKGVVSFASGDGHIYALDINTGKSKWRFPKQNLPDTFPDKGWEKARSEERTSAPTAVNGIIYIGTRGGLSALNAETGKQIWQFPTPSSVETTPLIQDGKIYIGSGSSDGYQGYIYGLDAQNGKLQWKYLNGKGKVNSDLAIANGVIYFGGISPSLHAVDLDTRKEKWEFPNRVSNSFKSAFVHGNSVFFVSDEVLYALDTETGKHYWKYLECTKCVNYPPIVQGPSLFNDKLYYLLRDKIYAFSVNSRDTK